MLNFRNYSLRCLILVFAIIAASNAQDEPLRKGILFNNSSMDNFKNETLLITAPSAVGFSLIMEEYKTVEIAYNIFCKNEGESFELEIRSADTKIFVVNNNQKVHISCENATRSRTILGKTDVHITMVTESTDSGYDVQVTQRDADKMYYINGTLTIDFYAIIIGGAKIQFLLHEANSSMKANSTHEVIVVEHQVTVFRTLRPVDTIFRVVIYFFLIFVTLAFGCKLDLVVVRESLKRPIAPGIGLVCQYVVVPVIGYGVAKVVTAQEPSVALGIFVAACCPGGGASNIYSHLLNGDLSLSITMTAISTVAALGMLPLWLYTLGQEFIDKTANVNVPFLNIFTTLLVLILPLFAGLFIKYKFPKLRKIFLKIVTPVTVVAIIVLLTVGIYSNLFIFKMFKPRIVLAGCLLPYFGYVLGGVISLIFRQPWDRVKTIAIETGMQNTGIAMILMIVAFPPPYGEIAAVAPIASGVMTPLPLFVITIVYLIYRRCNKDKYKEVPVKNGLPEELKVDGDDDDEIVKEKLSTV